MKYRSYKKQDCFTKICCKKISNNTFVTCLFNLLLYFSRSYCKEFYPYFFIAKFSIASEGSISSCMNILVH